MQYVVIRVGLIVGVAVGIGGCVYLVMHAVCFVRAFKQHTNPRTVSQCVNRHHPTSSHIFESPHSSTHTPTPRFSQQVLADDLLKAFYDGIDMRKLMNQQEKFMTLAFGGKELLDVSGSLCVCVCVCVCARARACVCERE